MNFGQNEKTAVFIDGGNLYSASKNIGFEVDYRNLLGYFRKNTNVLRAYYYTAILEAHDDNGEEAYNPLKPLTDWLGYNGYTVVKKPAYEYTDSSGKRRLRGTNVSIDMICDVIEMAPHVDNVVLFTGDADLGRAIDLIKRTGTRVALVSSVKTSPPLIADDLRRKADQFLDIYDIMKNFTKPPKD